MNKKRALTLAIERYDRHIPFFDGTVTPPDGVELEVFQVGQSATLRDGNGRHERMLHDGEFDVAEFSLSTFLMAKARGLPIAGIPIFPRRLFSTSQMWVHPDSDLHHPSDLRGRKVAISAFQNTLALLAKGDLKRVYDTPWEDIHWLLSTKEKVPFAMKDGVRADYIGGSREDIARLLADREIDAFFLPHPPHSIVTGKLPGRRLMADCPAEERRYFETVGDFPIMHVVAIRQELVDREPEIARVVYDLFEQAKALAETYYEDPAWSRLAWGRHNFEQERRIFGGDPWQNGFRANRETLARFIHYSADQGMIDAEYDPETLFVSDTLTT